MKYEDLKYYIDYYKLYYQITYKYGKCMHVAVTLFSKDFEFLNKNSKYQLLKEKISIFENTVDIEIDNYVQIAFIFENKFWPNVKNVKILSENERLIKEIIE